jgi:hypothetical protein
MHPYSINDDIKKYNKVIEKLKSLKDLNELAGVNKGSIKKNDLPKYLGIVKNFATLNGETFDDKYLELITRFAGLQQDGVSELAGVDFIQALFVNDEGNVENNLTQDDVTNRFNNFKINFLAEYVSNLNLSPLSEEWQRQHNIIDDIIEYASTQKEELQQIQKANYEEQTKKAADVVSNSRLKFTNEIYPNTELLIQLVQFGLSNDNKSTNDSSNLLDIQSFKNITEKELKFVAKKISEDTTISPEQKGILRQNLELIEKVRKKVKSNEQNGYITQYYIPEIQKKDKYNTGLSDLIIKSNSTLLEENIKALKSYFLEVNEDVNEDKDKVSHIKWKDLVWDTKVLDDILKPQTIKTNYIFDKPMMATEVLRHASNLKKVLNSTNIIDTLYKSPNILTSLYYIRDNVFGNLKNDIDNSVVAREYDALNQLIDYTQQNNLPYHINNLRSAKTREEIKEALIEMPDYLKQYITSNILSFQGKNDDEVVSQLYNDLTQKDKLCKTLENNIKKIIKVIPNDTSHNRLDSQVRVDITTILGNSVMSSATSKTKEALRENKINNLKAILQTVYNAVIGILRTAMTVFGGMKLFEVSQAQIQQENNQFRTNSNTSQNPLDTSSVITTGPNVVDPSSIITTGPNVVDPSSIITTGPTPGPITIPESVITNPQLKFPFFLSPAQTSYTSGQNRNTTPVTRLNLKAIQDIDEAKPSTSLVINYDNSSTEKDRKKQGFSNTVIFEDKETIKTP